MYSHEGAQSPTMFELLERLLKVKKSTTQTINEYESTFWELAIGGEKEEEAIHIEDIQKLVTEESEMLKLCIVFGA